MKKILLAGVVTGLGLVASGLGFWAKKNERIERLIADKLDCGCEIDDVTIDFLASPMQVKVEGLRLFQKQGDATPVLTVPKGSFTLQGLVSGEKVIDDLVLEQPMIHLEMTDKKANWEVGRKKTKGEIAPGKDKSEDIPNEGLAGLRKVSLVGGTIIYENAEKHLYAEARDVSIESEDASTGLFQLVATLNAKGAEADPAFLAVDLDATVTLATSLGQPDLLVESRFAEGSYLSRDFPVVHKVWGLVDKLRDYGVKLSNVPEKLALKSDKTFRCEINDGDVTLLDELALRSKKGWGISIAEGAHFASKTTEHSMTLMLGADAERSASLRSTVDSFTRKLPKAARVLAEKKIVSSLFKNDLLAVQYVSSGQLTKPSVKSLNPLPKLKDLVNDGVDGILRGLFRR